MTSCNRVLANVTININWTGLTPWCSPALPWFSFQILPSWYSSFGMSVRQTLLFILDISVWQIRFSSRKHLEHPLSLKSSFQWSEGGENIIMLRSQFLCWPLHQKPWQMQNWDHSEKASLQTDGVHPQHQSKLFLQLQAPSKLQNVRCRKFSE